MKIKFIIAILLVGWMSSVYGQNDEIDIKVIIECDQSDVKLRWLPINDYIWEKGNEFGYTVVRTSRDSTFELQIDTLIEGLKPLEEASWDSQFPNNEYAQSAKKMLYDQSILMDPNQIEYIKDAINLREQQEGRFLFSMVAAENDYNVAKAAGIGYVDSSADTAAMLSYKVFISDTLAMANLKSGHASVDKTTVALPAINNLILQADAEVMILNWDLTAVANIYTAWNIERAPDNIHFEKITVDPFIHGYADEVFEYLATYQDQYENCDKEFYYRIQGITPFGTKGPYSNTVSIDCPKDKMVIPLVINGAQEKDNGILVNWSTFEKEYEDKIQGFNVYRTKDMALSPEKLNSSLLKPYEREFYDKDGVTSGYYFLEIVDKNNDLHRSSEYFIQLYDDVPPGAPINLDGRFIRPQELTLDWDINTEDDLTGYNVYVANDRKATYVRKNSNVLKENIFTVKLNEQLITDSIFVKINAEDHFFNSSKYSEVVAFARPDVWAPSKPILEFAYPTPQGVALAWTYSGSDDRMEHKLQRRLKSQFIWKDLLIISKDNEVNYGQDIDVVVSDSKANYIDDSEVKPEEYIYRVIVTDGGKNEASSDWLTVIPFPIASADVIQEFKLESYIEEVPPSSEMVTQLTNIGSSNLPGQIASLTKKECSIELSWICGITENLSGFVIYRAMKGSGFKPIKEISVGTAMGLDNDVIVEGDLGKRYLGYVDKNLRKGVRYTYYVVGKYKSGTETPKSKILGKVVE